MSKKKQAFFRQLSLDEMSQDQWESLCDRCGLCCLRKFEDQKTGKIRYSGIACEFLDTHTCQCLVYEDRHFVNKECIALSRDIVKHLKWLPETCAYRRLAEGKKLPRWHPLVSGDPSTVHRAHMSARDIAVSGRYIHPEDIVSTFSLTKKDALIEKHYDIQIDQHYRDGSEADGSKEE